ncbi:protein involved in polysaccharide export, contains SLBB domain of the beta-grasp fold [Daejeonella rubra]|uniref:Protein involved in polysaccharide export, contains SLBB domain of the beta-grasp fold n=1 Tax=Daejeonella rubra TaxID=990371 RepID=A0A1G9WSS1_9SPHI|nr:SLBB domain-containing protein [Daejeonella rubra]SDM87654.1 protein involved in polysaccharide export, contains SLBB domain of the beta-grasp fold [Daejeonella rubra]
MKINKIFSLWVLLFVIGLNSPVFSQVNPQNLSNVKVDELSDDQIRAFITQAESTGMGDAQLEQIAQARGMHPEEIQKLRLRVNKLKTQAKTQTAGAAPEKSSNNERQLNYEPENLNKEVGSVQRSKIFGAELFKNSNLTFEPNLNMATPQNYVIGTNDEILITIFGNSEANYNLKVNPEGNINIEYVGVIQVAGLTVEAATSRIRSRMSKVYPGLAAGNTKLNIAIGNIRSIKVILTGEVQKPGSYTLPSLATVFNALYSSGGPTENGSFRAVELIRGGKIIATLDIYDFLLKGEISTNVRLQDQDIIRIPVYKSRIEISGEVKRPGIFELLKGESFNDLLNFSGDFTESAFKARVKVLKNTETERKITDISSSQFSNYEPASGDKYFVDKVLDRFLNRVTIQGAVFRPGEYELERGLSLTQLLTKAEGLKEDAFMQRGYITRLLPDNQTQLISFDLAAIVSGKIPDIQLFREDIINISSLFDLKEEFSISIEGGVRMPGTFPFLENVTLEELVMKAGGFSEGANSKRIEISRRVRSSDVLSASASIAEVFQLSVDKDLKFTGEPFLLQPFDLVFVRNNAGYEVQKQVKIQGEVVYPGTYTILRKDERISDLVKRAGGLTALAFAPAASLKRPKNSDSDNVKKESLRRLQSSIADSLDIDNQIESALNNETVGIRLAKILESPGSTIDLVLKEGDVVNIPTQLQTVGVIGEVLSPVTIVYEKGRNFKNYISQSGGFSDKSLKRKSYIIYANGSVKSTRKIIFFNNYPRVEPGSEIFVPMKAEKRPISATEIVGISSGLASLAIIILNLVK